MPAFVRQATILSNLQDVMGQLGLTVPTTAVGNTNRTVIQLLAKAKEVGNDLTSEDYKWQELVREHTITTVIGQTDYSLPSDFNGYVSDAQWNRTSRLPMFGSLAETEWQMLKARLLSGTTFTTLFRVKQDMVVLYATPTAVQTLVLPYTSRGWLLDVDGVTYKDNITADTDVVLLDNRIFQVALKRAWYIEKKFDTTKIDQQYDEVMAMAQSNDAPGRTLSLAGNLGFPYLSNINVPDTGYGS